MNNIISFTLKDIGVFVLWALIVIILYYFIVILKSLYMSIREVNKIVNKNQKNIDEILDEAPGIARNANNISKEVSDVLEKFKPSINNVAESSESVTKTLKENDTLNKKMASFFQSIGIINKLINKYIKGNSTDENN